jgi:hypothetical protein
MLKSGKGFLMITQVRAFTANKLKPRFQNAGVAAIHHAKTRLPKHAVKAAGTVAVYHTATASWMSRTPLSIIHDGMRMIPRRLAYTLALGPVALSALGRIGSAFVRNPNSMETIQRIEKMKMESAKPIDWRQTMPKIFGKKPDNV